MSKEVSTLFHLNLSPSVIETCIVRLILVINHVKNEDFVYLTVTSKSELKN